MEVQEKNLVQVLCLSHNFNNFINMIKKANQVWNWQYEKLIKKYELMQK